MKPDYGAVKEAIAGLMDKDGYDDGAGLPGTLVSRQDPTCKNVRHFLYLQAHTALSLYGWRGTRLAPTTRPATLAVATEPP